MRVVKLREPFIITIKQLELGTTYLLLQYLKLRKFTFTTVWERGFEKSLSNDEDQSIEYLCSLLHMGSFYIELRCCSSLLANVEFSLAEDIIFGESRHITAWG